MQPLLLRNVTQTLTKKYKDVNRMLKSSHCLNKLVFAHLNINSIRDKFDFLSEQVRGNVDVLMVSQTKIGDSFEIGRLLIHGFSPPYRPDRDSKGGGIMF